MAAELIRQKLATLVDPTLLRLDLTSAQVLDYRFVHLAFASIVYEILRDRVPSGPHRLVFRVRPGPQFKNLTLGLAWQGPGNSPPSLADAESCIADARRFCVIETVGSTHLTYLGIPEESRELISRLEAGFKSAVELRSSLARLGMEDLVARLRGLVDQGFVIECRQEGGDGTYASISYLLRTVRGGGEE